MILLEKLFDFGLSEAISVIKDKASQEIIKQRFSARLNTFSEEFSDTEIDTNTFEKYITESPLVSSYFTKVFFEGKVQENEVFDRIIRDAMDQINAKRTTQGISLFKNETLVRNYFKKLEQHIVQERVQILGIKDQLLTANVVENVVQTISEVIKEQLHKPSNENFKFTSQMLYEHNEVSITSLGERYSPEINIQTLGSAPFETLFKTKKFFLNFGNKYNDLVDAQKEFIKRYSKKDYQSLNSASTKDFDVMDALRKVEKVNELIVEIYEESDTLDEIQKHYFNRMRHKFYEFDKFAAVSKIKLFEMPYLIVTGEAAIGKSHLLADTVENMQQQGYPIIFLLGQQFLISKDPLRQMVDFFGYSISVEEFLYKFNRFAEEHGKRGCIIIDALNETDSNRFWENRLQAFTKMIAKFENIGIVYSVRSTYVANIIPESFINDNNFEHYQHNGITDAEDKEIEKIEKWYSLKRGELLKIYPEFASPLFLKIAAISKGDNDYSEGKITWEKIISLYIDKIERDISSENRLNYSGKYLSRILQFISQEMLMSCSNYLIYRDIKRKIAKELEYDMDTGKRYLDELIRESVLSKFTTFDGEEKIHFTYEKIRDFLIAHKVLIDVEKKKLQLSDVINEKLLPNKEYGIIEMLFFMIPNKMEVEITDFIPEVEESYNIHLAFIGSIPWRKVPLKSESIKQVLREILLNSSWTRVFLEKQFLLSIDPFSPFNSDWLTNWLLQLDNGLRDYVWTTNISTNTSDFSMQFIKRVKRNYTSMNDEQLGLALNQLVWLLASVNRNIRDRATKLITLLLLKQPKHSISLLNRFSEVTDYYIKERLYAAVFGYVVKSQNDSLIEEIACIVYNNIFDKEDVVPNVLLRDYARQIIEFAFSKNLCVELSKEKITPPYNSSWYDYKLTNEDVDNFEENYNTQIEKDAVHRIKSSMTTEYGRGVGGYGDFGRYTFGSRVSPWTNQFNDQDLSNIAFKRVFDLGYNPKLHAHFDRYDAQSYDRHDHRIERIGKKYQWLAFYELLAKLADNFPTYNEKIIYDDEYEEYQRKRRSKRVFDYLTKKDDTKIDNFEDEDLSEQSIKAEDHIVEIKKFNFRYFQGPYEDYMKTIDPTCLLENTSEKERLISYNFEPSLTNDKLFSNHDKFIECEFMGKTYTNLYVSYKNEVKDDNKKSSNLVAVGFFAKPEDIGEIIEDNSKNYGQGVSAPYSVNIFLHELFWSPAYDSYAVEVEEEEEKYDEERIKSKDYAVFEYLWESNDDYSIEDAIRIYNPSKLLVNYFSLNSIEDGVWKDRSGNIVAFDGVVFGYENSLWFETERLNEYLIKTAQTVLWRSWGEESINQDFVEKWFLIEKVEDGYRNHISKIEIGDYKRI